MAEISLRSYNNEIEKLIDRGLIEEAVAHCRQILSFYPKCIATYKVLAKAFLENKNYSSASDVFFRVLSVFPDDFISHVGMSIIKEDEGNLDAAIWHMEMAFDIQPSNLAVQEELRRLFGRRDGVQPEKIHLTRGALIRMYARGELFQQAIAEIQAAVEEDPKRVDLEVILAQMYFQSSSFVEATEVCSHLLNKLPYIFEANHILSMILPNTAQAENAKIYKDRLITLDPYYSFVSSPEISSDSISDDKIRIERLVYDQSGLTSVPQDWSRSLDNEWKLQPQEETPEWLENIQEDAAPIQANEMKIDEPQLSRTDETVLSATLISDSSTESQPSQPFLSENDSEIPDWMRNAGWIPSSGEPMPETESQESIESDSLPENPQPADLPDWLKDLVPEKKQASELLENIEELTSEKLDDLDNLPEIQDQNSIDSLSNKDETLSENDNLASDQIEEQPSTPPEEIGEKMSPDNFDSANNEWLNQFRSDSEKPENSVPEDDKDLPDWLRNFEEEQKQPSKQEDDLPDWLHSLQDKATDLPADENVDEQHSEEIKEPPAEEINLENLSTPVVDKVDDLLNDRNQLFTKMLNSSEHSPNEDQTGYLQPESHPLPTDWQKDVAEEEKPAETEPEQPTTPEIPEWVRNALKITNPTDNVIEKAEKEPLDANTMNIPESVIPSSEPEAALNSEAVQPEETTGVISEETNNELLDWLRSINTDETGEPAPSEESIDSIETEVTQSQESDINLLDRIPGFETPEAESSEQPSMKSSEENEMADSVISFVRESEEPVTEFTSDEQTYTTNLVPSFEPEVQNQENSETIQQVTSMPVDASEAAVISTDLLQEIDLFIQNGQVDEAVNQYSTLIKDQYNPSLIENSVRANIDRNPEQPELWQVLGDVLARYDRLDDALLAYEKAESLLLQKYNV